MSRNTAEPLSLDVKASEKDPSKQRPGMSTVFDSSPNARSKTLKTVDGPHTYGRLNEMPAHHSTYTLGIAEDVGARRTMEDAYSFVVDYAGLQGQGFFAVFDGHAGKHAAEWCGAHFHEMLLLALLEDTTHPIPEVMANTFKSVDEVLTKMSENGTTNSGCTAVTAFLRLEDANGKQTFAPPISTLVTAPTITPVSSRSGQNSEANSRSSTPTSSKRERLKNLVSNPFGGTSNSSKKFEASDAEPTSPSHAINPNAPVRRVLYTANVGDARAVLARQGRGVRLTYDHKGSDAKEVRRIQEAGGFVLNNRVNGVLAVTRSLGDSAMKDFVVGSPYSSEVELEEGDEFLIIACDGLWDVVEDQGAVDLIKESKTAQNAADILLRHALDNFSHDNVTVLVVMFGKQGEVEQGMASAA